MYPKLLNGVISGRIAHIFPVASCKKMAVSLQTPSDHLDGRDANVAAGSHRGTRVDKDMHLHATPSESYTVEGRALIIFNGARHRRSVQQRHNRWTTVAVP